MNDETIPAPGSFKDRSTGLMVYGILTIILGMLVGLFVPMMIAAGSINAANGAGSPGIQPLVPAIALYSFMAIANIWLGIGSIMKRRWARALLLISSWSWLIIGGTTTIVMAVAMPFFSSSAMSAQSPASSGIQAVIMVVAIGTLVGIFIAIPLAWLLFYRSPHVKATCESFDPLPRWTDACPLPVLAMTLWMAIGALSMVAMATVGTAVLPFFGVLLSGLPARATCLILAGLWALLAWGLYRLDLRAWWLVGVFFLLYMISSLITFNLHGLAELYTAMHMDPKIYAPLVDSPYMKIYMIAGPVVFTLLTFGYLAFIRKFFLKSAVPPSSL